MLSIVIPTFHEALNIPPLAERLRTALGPERAHEVIFVDDDSGDGIEQAVGQLQREGHPVRIIVRRGERGLSSAVIHGFREARGEQLLCMDADLSHPPEAIPAMFAVMAATGADMVLGSRFVGGAGTDADWGAYRRLNSWVARMLARGLTSIKDPMSGFFLLPKRVFANARDLNPIGYKIALELIVKCPCRKVVEMPIHFSNRLHGASKLSWREQLRYLVHLGRLYAYRPSRAGSAVTQ